MDFDLSPEQQDFQKTVRQFVDDAIRPNQVFGSNVLEGFVAEGEFHILQPARQPTAAIEVIGETIASPP